MTLHVKVGDDGALKEELARLLVAEIHKRNLGPNKAARELELSQGLCSDLKRGVIKNISTGRVIRSLRRFGYDIELTVTRTP